MDDYIITQDGKPLAKSKYTIDLDAKTFSSKESDLLLDFSGLTNWYFNTTNHCTFKTRYGCTFKTGAHCTFNTSNSCTFNTGAHCTFNTSNSCTFNTGYSCTFKTGDICTFKTVMHCTFNTGYSCTFKTGAHCKFTTGKYCTFMLSRINTCKFKSYDDISIILDRSDKKHYLLTKELITMLKVING